MKVAIPTKRGDVLVDEVPDPIERDRIRRCIKEQTCPWCGRGPWVRLARHTFCIHGVSADDLRRLADWPLTRSVTSPEDSERNRQIALQRDMTHRHVAGAAGAAAWHAARKADPARDARQRRLLQRASRLQRTEQQCSHCGCWFCPLVRTQRATCSDACEHARRVETAYATRARWVIDRGELGRIRGVKRSTPDA